MIDVIAGLLGVPPAVLEAVAALVIALIGWLAPSPRELRNRNGEG